MRAAGTPPLHIAGRGQDGGLQLHRGVVQSRPPPFWHPLPIPDCLRDADTQGNPNDLSDKPSTKPGQLQLRRLSLGHYGSLAAGLWSISWPSWAITPAQPHFSPPSTCSSIPVSRRLCRSHETVCPTA